MPPAGQPQDQLYQCAALVRVQLSTTQPNEPRTREGNAVYLGDGVFLTARHVVEGADLVRVEVRGLEPILAEPVWNPEWAARLARRDLCLLQVEPDEPLPPLMECKLAVWFDRWDTLKVGSWQEAAEASSDYRVRRGEVESEALVPYQSSEPLCRLRLSEASAVSLRGCSGSGVFDRNGNLVGILCNEERWEHAGSTERVYFATLEDWPDLFAPSEAPGTRVERLPYPWADGARFLLNADGYDAAHPALYGREALVAAIERTLATPHLPSGYLVLLGGPRRGKSAIMAELIRRSGLTRRPWIFATRGQSPAETVALTLARQLGYLLGKTEAEMVPYLAEGSSTALKRLLTEASQRGSSLVLYLDALDEIDGGERLEFLPKPLPTGVYVVVSLRHDPERRAEVTQYRPCLGVLQMDREAVDLDLDLTTPVQQLEDQETIQASDAAAIEQIWQEYGMRTVVPMPTAFRSRLAEYQWPVGYHMAYSTMLRTQRGPSLSWPDPDEIPRNPEAINTEYWQWISEQQGWDDAGERLGNRTVLGLLAVAHDLLPEPVIRELAGWDADQPWQLFRRLANPVLNLSTGGFTHHHASWRDLVVEKLGKTGRRLSDCQWLLANGSRDRTPRRQIEQFSPEYRDYWYRFRLQHLMEILEAETRSQPRSGKKATPDAAAAAAAWSQHASDPDCLATAGTHPRRGVDLVVADLHRGVRNPGGLIPQDEDWAVYREILYRGLGHLRSLPPDEEREASDRVSE